MKKGFLIVGYVIEIIALIVAVVAIRYVGIKYYNRAVEMCDIGSYNSYITTKHFCDFIRAEDVKRPDGS